MTKVFTFLALLISGSAFGQKYMIHGKDTLPYKNVMIVKIDTLLKDGKTTYKADTTYQGTCRTFEKINGRIVNQTDTNCVAQGPWIITDKYGNYWSGCYKDGDEDDTWQYFNKSHKLLEDRETVHLAKDHYIVKQIDYRSGQPITLIRRPCLAFLINNFIVILFASTISFLLRLFINNDIYNSENGTDYSMFGNRFKLKIMASGELSHRLCSAFTIWFSKYKPQNRQLAIISNGLTIICMLTILLCILVALGL